MTVLLNGGGGGWTCFIANFVTGHKDSKGRGTSPSIGKVQFEKGLVLNRFNI